MDYSWSSDYDSASIYSNESVRILKQNIYVLDAVIICTDYYYYLKKIKIKLTTTILITKERKPRKKY